MVVKWWAVVLLSQADICAVYWGGLWFISQSGGDQCTLITGESLSSTMSVHRSIIPASKQQYHNTIYNGILTAIIPLCYLPDTWPKEAHYQCTDIAHCTPTKHTYQQTCPTYYCTTRTNQAVSSWGNQKQTNKQKKTIKKGTDRLHTLNTDTILLSNYQPHAT